MSQLEREPIENIQYLESVHFARTLGSRYGLGIDLDPKGHWSLGRSSEANLLDPSHPWNKQWRGESELH